ncbi:MAG: hypothetical protein HY063_10630 [Bacteroidetes bacterium]|nr:hypothetical protein [Bacteroidota bacterium]
MKLYLLYAMALAVYNGVDMPNKIIVVIIFLSYVLIMRCLILPSGITRYYKKLLRLYAEEGTYAAVANKINRSVQSLINNF